MTRARVAAAWRIEELVLDRASSKAQSEAELTTGGTSMLILHRLSGRNTLKFMCLLLQLTR